MAAPTQGRPEAVNPPAYLPPRRPKSLPSLEYSHSSWRVTTDGPRRPQPPPFLPPRQPAAHLSGHIRQYQTSSRPDSPESITPGTSLSRKNSTGSIRRGRRSGSATPIGQPSLEPIQDGEILRTRFGHLPACSSISRYSSLRMVSRPSEEQCPSSALGTSRPDSHLRRSDRARPVTHPSSRFEQHSHRPLLDSQDDMTQSWQNFSRPLVRGACSALELPLPPKPKPTFSRLSSLDSLMTYREEMTEWKRVSRASSLRHEMVEQLSDGRADERSKSPDVVEISATSSMGGDAVEGSDVDELSEDPDSAPSTIQRSRFRHIAAEVVFCLTIALTGFLAEYLISGFAMELPKLFHAQAAAGSMGMFWPAILLPLILSATLLVFARLSDMYSGYFIFMFGVALLAISTLVPGLSQNLILLDVCRAFQGLAIAAFTPSTFTMLGSIYSDGPRKNFVLGLYAGCAPLGFFAGNMAAGALPSKDSPWYFFVAAILSGIAFTTGFLSVPADRTDRTKLELKMDWIGGGLIVAGLMLVLYALSVEPSANERHPKENSWAFPTVYAPLVAGCVCLAVAVWYESFRASCPLLPLDFFKPKSLKALSLACLLFYASFGAWLYNSAEFIQLPGVTSIGPGSEWLRALWYIPSAVVGIVLCILSGKGIHKLPLMVLLLISSVGWIAAPLFLGLALLPLNYWEFVLPSMAFASIGLDLTYTVSIVFFSSVQEQKYQGLSGAVASSLINLAMSFGLTISEIVKKEVIKTDTPTAAQSIWGYQTTFFYAAASAGVGLVICVLLVRVSRSVVRGKCEGYEVDEEMALGVRSSDSTLVEEGADLQMVAENA